MNSTTVSPNQKTHHSYARPLIERFWKKVDVQGPDDCWNWKGTLHPHGYGRIANNKHLLLTHRVSYEIHFGSIPEGLLVCHKCNNPRCVNPNHLYAGSTDDNMKDRLLAGRYACGERHENAKLTEQEVGIIRTSFIPYTVTIKMLAERFGVSTGAVSAIVYLRDWKHLLDSKSY